MKSMDEIKMLPRTLITVERPDGFAANVQLLSSTKSRPARVIGSWGCWWDHISVSFSNRMPTWDEMEEVKRMFFKPEEIAMQLHPAEDEYVNFHRYCLHLWRPQPRPNPVIVPEIAIPTPPSWMIGPRKGETLADIDRIGEKEMRKWEEEIRGRET